MEHKKFDDISEQNFKFTINGVLSHSQSDINQVEDNIINVLECIKVYPFNIVPGVGNILNLHSTKNLIENIANGNKVNYVFTNLIY